MFHVGTAAVIFALASSLGGSTLEQVQIQHKPSQLLSHVADPGVLILGGAQQTIPGVTRPIREVMLAAPFDATLTQLHVHEGDQVHAGQLIATMDDRVARASLAMAEQAANQTASIARAQASLDRAAQRLERTLKATRAGGANQTELENAQADAAIAEAELRQAEEAREAATLRLELAKAELAEREIRAPFAGTVIQTHTEDGTTLRVGDSIAEIADLTRQRVDLYLNPATALNIAVGDPYSLQIGSEVGPPIAAIARFVEPRIDPASGTTRVAFEIEAQDRVPPPGSLARPTTADVLAEADD